MEASPIPCCTGLIEEWPPQPGRGTLVALDTARRMKEVLMEPSRSDLTRSALIERHMWRRPLMRCCWGIPTGLASGQAAERLPAQAQAPQATAQRPMIQWRGVHLSVRRTDATAPAMEIPVRRGSSGAGMPSRRPITLYDLIAAIQEVVGPEDDGLVVATVRNLLQSGQLNGRGAGTRLCPPPRQD